MKGRAFTLVEVLCVVSIVGLLAALLFPVFQQAIVASTRTRAISNMRELHVAALLYVEQNGEEPGMLVGVPSGISFLRSGQLDALMLTGGWEGGSLGNMPVLADPDPLPWQGHVERCNGNPVVFFDGTHDWAPRSRWPQEPFAPKRGSAIYFDGHVESRISQKRPDDPAFWEPRGKP